MASSKTENVVSNEANTSVVVSALASQSRKSNILSRIWNGIFRGGKEDFEKKLEYLSKEEASVHARSKRRSQNWRKIARFLIIYSVILEIGALAIAIMSTRSPDITWQNRAWRVLPVFAVPRISVFMYSSFAGYFRMRDKKDQKTLEKLRAERRAKIDELKERTNYYVTQQLIQRYDLDPAAKAAAASSLVSKLGAEAGLNISIQDANLVQNEGKSYDVEVVQPAGLRNRKQLHGRSQSVGSVVTDQLAEQPVTSTMPVSPSDGGREQGFAADHRTRARASDGGWIGRLAAMLVGEDPTQCYALICANCHMHNDHINECQTRKSPLSPLEGSNRTCSSVKFPKVAGMALLSLVQPRFCPAVTLAGQVSDRGPGVQYDQPLILRAVTRPELRLQAMPVQEHRSVSFSFRSRNGLEAPYLLANFLSSSRLMPSSVNEEHRRG